MRQPIKFGKYLLLERIAVGGMAEVFVAKAFGVEGFERLLAIKKILPTMGEDQEFQTMFVDEARIAVQLSHANVIQILELGKQDDNLFIAMEYISGRDLRQLLERFRKRGKPMPIPQACTIVAKVCEALDYAHRKRDTRGAPLYIVHRDVSPQNVIVSFEGDVKLIDFGIAKAESRLQQTQAGILKGKFAYMSPEQVRGQPIDHRSDVFAVGVLLWELLCGEKLFTGDSDFAVLEKVRTGQVPAPRSYNRDITEALERVVMRALAPEVADRYQWAGELHDALVRFTLIGDTIYGSRQLAEWMREEFSSEYEKEQARLRAWSAQSAHPSAAPVSVDDDETPSDPSLSAEIFASQAPVSRAPPAPVPAREQSVPAPARGVAFVDEELPTMKMDGAELVAAERAFALRRSPEPRITVEHLTDADEPTNVGEPPPFDDPSLAHTMPEPYQVEPAAPQVPQGSPVSPLPRIPDLTPPNAVAAPMAWHEAGPAPVVTSRLSLNTEKTQPLPSQPFAAESDNDVTVARRMERKGGLSRPQREPDKQSPRLLRGLLVAGPLLVAAAGIAVLLWPNDPHLTGRLVVTVTPSVPAELFVDGKDAGALPPFVRTLPRGVHVLEVKADGYRSFTTSATVGSSTRPLEVEAELAANGPQHLELQGVVLNQPEPREPETSSADEPADAATRVVPRESMHHWPFSRHRAAAKKIAAAKRTSEGKKVAAAGPTLGVASASLVPPSLGSPQLIINTDPPAALVTVDGHALGRSPAIAKGLDPLEVHVVSASLPGFTLIKQNVRFDEGSPVTDVRLVLSRHRDASVASGRTVLVPGSGASARPPEAVDPHPVAEVAPALAAATAALVPTADPQGPVGYLVAATYPVAKVSIDGRDSGRWTPVAPVNPIALSPGSHTVVFETMQGKKQEQRVDIEAGKTSRVIIRQLQ